MNDRLERNKETVKPFYGLMFNQCKPSFINVRFAGDPDCSRDIARWGDDC